MKQNFSIKKNLIYKTVDGKNLTGDLYLPKSQGLRPAVVVVHGGGWKRRAGKMQKICRELAQSGIVAFNTTYRLAPKNHFPLAVEDIRDSVLWIKTQTRKFQIDEHQISGWGYSAGANLISLAGLDGSLSLKTIIAGGIPADLTKWPNSSMINNFIGHTFKDRPDLWKKASPINYVTDQTPPMFLYHGEWDLLVEPDQMKKMMTALEQKNRNFETYVVKYMGHLAVYFLDQKSINIAIQFIKKHTSSTLLK